MVTAGYKRTRVQSLTIESLCVRDSKEGNRKISTFHTWCSHVPRPHFIVPMEGPRYRETPPYHERTLHNYLVLQSFLTGRPSDRRWIDPGQGARMYLVEGLLVVESY